MGFDLPNEVPCAMVDCWPAVPPYRRMRRPRRYYEIYAELRRTLGPEVTAKDIARLAAHLIRSNDDPHRLGASWKQSVDRSYERKPVDRVLFSPSWDTVQEEARRSNQPGDCSLSLEAAQRLSLLQRGQI